MEGDCIFLTIEKEYPFRLCQRDGLPCRPNMKSCPYYKSEMERDNE